MGARDPGVGSRGIGRGGLTIAPGQAERNGCTVHSALYTAGSSLFTVGCVVWLASAVRTSRAAAQRAAGEKKADASA